MLIVLLVVLLLGGYPVSADTNEPPTNGSSGGDWLVDTSNARDNETLEITGNISLTAGAVLYLNDTILNFNHTVPTSINITTGTTLELNNCFLNSTTGQFISIRAEGTLVLRNITIDDLGTLALDNPTSAIIDNLTVRNGLAGLAVVDSTGGVELKNLDVSNVTTALFLRNTDNVGIQGARLHNSSIGVQLTDTGSGTVLDGLDIFQNSDGLFASNSVFDLTNSNVGDNSGWGSRIHGSLPGSTAGTNYVFAGQPNGQGRWLQEWELGVSVVDLDQVPIIGATVNASNVTQMVDSMLTDNSGEVSFTLVQQHEDNLGTIVDHNDHTIDANFSTTSNSTSHTLLSDAMLLIELDLTQVNSGDWIISSDQTCDLPLVQAGNITVTNGATFTVACDLRLDADFAGQFSIKVDPGATLFVDHGSILAREMTFSFGIPQTTDRYWFNASGNVTLDGAVVEAFHGHNGTGGINIDNATLRVLDSEIRYGYHGIQATNSTVIIDSTQIYVHEQGGIDAQFSELYLNSSQVRDSGTWGVVTRGGQTHLGGGNTFLNNSDGDHRRYQHLDVVVLNGSGASLDNASVRVDDLSREFTVTVIGDLSRFFLLEEIVGATTVQFGAFNITASLGQLVKAVEVPLEQDTSVQLVLAPGPDIQILDSDILLGDPTPLDGDLVQVVVQIRNLGDQDASNFVVELSEDGTALASTTVSIPAFSSSAAPFTWNARFGSHLLEADADTLSSVTESDETNNRGGQTVLVGGRPDLVVEEIVLSDENPGIGQNITITAVVTNLGNEPALNFASRLSLDGQVIASSQQDLGAGNSTNISASWDTVAGTHQLEAVADSSTAITEANETNNYLARQIHLGALPDFFLQQDLSMEPEPVDVGDDVVLSATVWNNGGPSNSPVTITFYLDGNAGTVLLGSENATIATGANATMERNWTTTAGIDTFRVVVDENNDIAEILEDNNEFSVPVIIAARPDLRVTQIVSSPFYPERNSPASISAYVTNQGGSPATFNVTMDLDGTGALGPPVSLTLDALATSIVNMTWADPLPGNHTILVRADPEDRVTELDETNNELSRHFEVLDADSDVSLVPGSMRFDSSSVVEGSVVEITVELINNGAAISRNTELVFYWSQDTTNRTEFWTILVDDLPANAQRPYQAIYSADQPGTIIIFAQIENEVYIETRTLQVTLGDPGNLDSDGDGIADISDNCPGVINPGQEDKDGDGIGDVCDPDPDGSGPSATDSSAALTGNEIPLPTWLLIVLVLLLVGGAAALVVFSRNDPDAADAGLSCPECGEAYEVGEETCPSCGAWL